MRRLVARGWAAAVLLAALLAPIRVGADTNTVALLLPPPPKCPVDFFRELLALTPAERRQALTNRPPESQQRILAKVQEYQALPADERERQFTLGQKRHRLVLHAEIEDNGPGIPEELRERIFFPLVTGRADGTGLGLSIAQTIVHQHGGVIECHSRPGQTIFRIYLPLENGHD